MSDLYDTFDTFDSKVSYKSDNEPFGQNEMARKRSYKYDIEKQEKSLLQAICPISLTALYISFESFETSMKKF